ncbi:hypothetical protein MPLA_180087 [Mesorhizobium sp. ORS 3359]|nr:hypothetical protein MPLA_180087 [Mesorhizobium sp. ORS 3359]
MIIVSFLYPNTERARFDAACYVEKHAPLALGLLGDAVRGVIVETGLGGAAGCPRALHRRVSRAVRVAGQLPKSMPRARGRNSRRRTELHRHRAGRSARECERRDVDGRRKDHLQLHQRAGPYRA